MLAIPPSPIVFVLRSVSHGGAEQHLFELMKGLRDRGLTCIYAGPKGGWLAQAIQSEGFEFLPLAMRGTYDVVSMARLAWFLKVRGIGLVHGHLARGAFYAGIASRLMGRPCPASVHATTVSRHYQWPNHLVAVSDAVAKSLVQQGYQEAKVSKIYLGLADEGSKVPPVAAQPQETGGPIVFGMAARFIADKGHDVAVRALARLNHLDCRLKLAGNANNAWGNSIASLASELGVIDRVEFLGHCDDMPAFYKAVDVIVAPSRREALSLTLIEAAMHGLPVVASRVGGIPEVVIHGQTGFLADPEDTKGFADALNELGTDAALRHNLGGQARMRYLQCFTQDTMIAAIVDLYQKLIASNNG